MKPFPSAPARIEGASREISTIDLVVTACEGREHLLVKTMQSLRASTTFQFRKLVLAVDGRLDASAIAQVSPDIVVQNWRRSGYVTSIIHVTRQLDGDAFFWLEDDWTFARPLDVERLVSALNRHEDWVQIRLSKTGPLSATERAVPLGDGFFESAWGFSANPSLNRTSHLKTVVEELQFAPRERLTGFETFFTEWFTAQKLVCAVDDPGTAPAIGHEGYLESTPRQFHMLASLDGEISEHLPGIISRPSLVRKLMMLTRLLIRALSLGMRQFHSTAAYEMAFRVVTLPIPEDVTHNPAAPDAT